MASIREIEIERVERMIRVLKMPTKKKYSARQKAVDLITIAELEERLKELQQPIEITINPTKNRA